VNEMKFMEHLIETIARKQVGDHLRKIRIEIEEHLAVKLIEDQNTNNYQFSILMNS
jgi:hypothetical protein